MMIAILLIMALVGTNLRDVTKNLEGRLKFNFLLGNVVLYTDVQVK